MQVSLSSDNYNIISNGITFLFGKDKDLKIEVIADNGFQFTIIMEFKADSSGESRIDTKFFENEMKLLCFNFEDSGTGTKWPVKIGMIDGKGLYLIFWSYIQGENAARSVQYSIFLEK